MLDYPLKHDHYRVVKMEVMPNKRVGTIIYRIKKNYASLWCQGLISLYLWRWLLDVISLM